MIKSADLLLMDEKVVGFLEQQTCFTLATSKSNVPYCAHCFYAFNEPAGALVFKSSENSKHMLNALANEYVAGTVNPDKLQKGRIRGIQFQGLLADRSLSGIDDAKKIYYKKYPFALAVPGEIWQIKLVHVKMTDNTLGFGHKLEWGKQFDQL